MLELNGVTKRYGELTALSDCSFQAQPGSLTGFVGPNGAGKTTAMRAVLGLVSLDSGAVNWQGHPVLAADRRAFGYMPEERGLYPTMQVLDQLVFLGRLSGMPVRTATREATRWLEAFGLGDRKSSRLGDLSHGNQQRVQLAAALVHSPDLLVLDEPFSGLDPLAMDSMSACLRELAATGAVVLFSSHQLDVVEHICEDVVVIDAGRVVLSGRLDALRDAAPDRFLDVTVVGSPHRLLRIPHTTVVASEGAHVLLRVPREFDAVALVAQTGIEITRLSYQPPSLSDLFRTAVERAVTSEARRVVA